MGHEDIKMTMRYAHLAPEGLRNGIEHTKTKARHPQTNGIGERFHKTVLHEFYQVAFRRSCIILWRNCRPTWMSGWTATTRREPIKAKRAAAERLCRRSLTANNSGWKRSDDSTDRTGATSKMETTVRSSLNYYITTFTISTSP